MLFSMRHKTYAGQVLDVFLEASSLERATKVAGAYCKNLGHGLVFVKSAVVADESIFATNVVEFKGACERCGTEFAPGDVVELSRSGAVLGHRVCPSSVIPDSLLVVVAAPKEVVKEAEPAKVAGDAKKPDGKDKDGKKGDKAA